MLEKTVVISRMNELAKFIGYEPNDITFLSKAMHCQRIHREGDGKNRKNYTNDSLATLGDSLLKFILTEYLFDNGYDNVKGVTVYKNFSQQSIVDIYNQYITRKEINEKLKTQNKDLCPILIKGSLEDGVFKYEKN